MPNNTSKLISALTILKNFKNIKFIKIVFNKILFKLFQPANKNSTLWAKKISIGSTTDLLNIIDKEFYNYIKDQEILTLEKQIQKFYQKFLKY